jgi:hypothetical protein
MTDPNPAEVETVARTLDVACGFGDDDRDMAERFGHLDWPEDTSEDGKEYWRTVARAAIAALAQCGWHPHYTSTYCIHGEHAACRMTCKTCDAACRCDCHGGEES